MTREECGTMILKSLSKIIGEKAFSVDAEKKLVSDIGLESIDLLDLLFEIEKETQLSINLSEAFVSRRAIKNQQEQFDLTVNEVIDYVMELKAKA